MARDQKGSVTKVLMDEEVLKRTVRRMAAQIHEEFSENESLILMGVASRGIPLAALIAEELESLYGSPVQTEEIDATFYRDDFHFRNQFKNPTMQVSNATLNLDGKNIVLIDDVLYTGRSARAALNALMDLGRPALIRFVVLVDRGHRELPIQADIIGLDQKTQGGEEVRVHLKPIDEKNAVELVSLEGNHE